LKLRFYFKLTRHLPLCSLVQPLQGMLLSLFLLRAISSALSAWKLRKACAPEGVRRPSWLDSSKDV
jgi:hypothetical protein